MEKHCQNAHKVAGFLKNHPKVTAVNFAGLEGDRSSATEYGMQVKVGSSASYAFRILGNGSEVFRVRGSGAITAQGSNTVWHQQEVQ